MFGCVLVLMLELGCESIQCLFQHYIGRDVFPVGLLMDMSLFKLPNPSWAKTSLVGRECQEYA